MPLPLTVGVTRTSLKENERRIVIHPSHLDLIPPDVRRQLVFESGYGAPWNVTDAQLIAGGSCVAPRDELFRQCDVTIVFKPVLSDFQSVREGKALWCCPHFVQQQAFTQAAIDRRLTVIAIESMHVWDEHGRKLLHAFQPISELGGYAGVLDAMRNRGIDGRYGPPRKTIVVGFGPAGRGAVHALQGLGFQSVRVFTFRRADEIANTIPGVLYHQVAVDADGHMVVVEADGSRRRFIDELRTADVIVNAIGQDPEHPKMIIAPDEVSIPLKNGCVIVDSACDEGMGFPFARPTTFDAPLFAVGEAYYYGVDHTPSYVWDSASWEISKSFHRYIPVVMGGPDAWDANETVRRAIEVRNGVVQRPAILSHQKRSAEYPHAVNGGDPARHLPITSSPGASRHQAGLV